MFKISPLQPGDLAEVDALLDRVFGPDRLAKTSYRFRQGIEPVKGLGFVTRKNGAIVGTVRYWPIHIGEEQNNQTKFPALLLGPLAVDPGLHGAGVGAGLIDLSLAIAAGKGYLSVLLVGDMEYYGRFGFTPAAPKEITMEPESDRLLVLELGNSSDGHPTGDVTRARQAAAT